MSEDNNENKQEMNQETKHEIKQEIKQEMKQEFKDNMKLDVKNKDMVITIVLWLFLGMFGVHRMYLGKTGSGIAMLCLNLLAIFTMWLVIGFVIWLAVFIWWILDIITIVKSSKS